MALVTHQCWWGWRRPSAGWRAACRSGRRPSSSVLTWEELRGSIITMSWSWSVLTWKKLKGFFIVSQSKCRSWGHFLYVALFSGNFKCIVCLFVVFVFWQLISASYNYMHCVTSHCISIASVLPTMPHWSQDQYNHNRQVRWPRLQAEPRLCLDAQGEGEGRGDQQDDPGDH